MGSIVGMLLTVMAGMALWAPPGQAHALFGTTSPPVAGDSVFYRIDPTTGAATPIGPVGSSRVSGIAFHPTTGVLYGVGFDGLTHVLLTIDKATGAGTTIGPTNVSTAAGCRTVSDISFRADGTLYAYAEPCDTLGVIDTSTGAFTLLGVTGQENFGNGIAFSPGDVLLHAGGETINGPFGVEPGHVDTLDQTTGAVTPGARLTFPATCTGGPTRRINALDFHPNTGALFAVMNCHGVSHRLGTLNTSTGVITEIGESVFGLDAIAFQPATALEPSLTDFRDVRRPSDISIGLDVGGTGQQALNFIGNAGAAGDTWITVYDPVPNPPLATFGRVTLSADVLIHTFNNKKGAGLLALYNEAPSKKGLALTLYSAGNTDTLVLATVDQAGKLVTLKAVSLGTAIVENAWYRVGMAVSVDAGLVSVIGTVVKHEAPTDPDSALTTQVGPSLTFSGALGAGALAGVDATGEVGILAAAVSAANSSSVTNVLIDAPTAPTAPTLVCAPPTQTVSIGQTASVAATGGTGTYAWSAPGSSTPTGAGSTFTTSYPTAGTHTITVTSGAQTDTCQVLVPPPAG